MCTKRLKHVEEAWKSKTNASNTLFNAGKFEESLVGYEQALSRAEVLNNYMEAAIRIGIPSIQTFVISCNNIAFTYEKLELFDKGATMLKRAIYFLLVKSKNTYLNIEEIRSELKRALLNYLDYANRNAMALNDVDKVFLDIQEQLEINKTT
ncbi:MAG: tetratricopeptide repeat protein [Gelidibacter sp.]